MELVSLHPKAFSQLFEVLKENITDNLIHFHPDCIKIRATDPAKTCITYVHIVGASLDKYHCAKYQPVGVHIPKLWTVLKTASADDILVMQCEENHEETLKISIKDGETREPKLETSYITYDCDEDVLSIPENIDFDSCISMDSARLHSDLKTLESMEAEYVKLRQCKSPSGGNRLQLIGLGSQFHRNPSMNIDETAHKDNIGTAQVKLEEIEMSFPLKKLVHFAKAACLDDKVALHLDKRGFLILQYKIKIYGELQFVIQAINDEEDDDDYEDDEEESETTRKREHD